MDSLLDEAIDKVKILPESEQRRIAMLILEEFSKLEDDEKNDELDEFDSIIESCKIKIKISDLSYQDDHYLYGTPKNPLE